MIKHHTSISIYYIQVSSIAHQILRVYRTEANFATDNAFVMFIPVIKLCKTAIKYCSIKNAMAAYNFKTDV